MAVEQHPQYLAWSEAFEHLVQAERRYHIALMEKRMFDEIQQAASDLDEARTRYRTIADEIE